jgi:hypothetical protein
MKKIWIFLSLLMLVSLGFGQTLQWCGNSKIFFNDNWYRASLSSELPAFNGQNLGPITSLILGGELETWEQVFGVSAEMGYKINQGEINHVISSVPLPWSSQSGNNDVWQNTGANINISSLDAGVYSLTIWFHAYIGETHKYDNNEGNDYVATFTIPDDQVPITLASFAADAVQGVVNVTWVTESETENNHFVLRRNGEILATIDGAGTTTESHTYAFVDRHVETGRVYSYALSDVSYGGVETAHDAITVEILAGAATESFALEAAYPNPFNPQTTVPYSLATDSPVDLAVYNTRGMRVATLFSGEREAGTYESVWHAANMPSGIYLIRMTAEGRILTQKVVLMK